MSNYNNIEKTVLEYLSETFPAPFYINTNKYEVGTILYTANPYWRTNATIVDIKNSSYIVLTDIGNVMSVDLETLQQDYLPPVCKRAITLPESMDDYYRMPGIGKIPLYPRVK